jgi:DNA-directed RNA polymerase specialized sigma24 family protein
MKNREAAQREYDLVQRALTGDQHAWYLLFHEQQPRLIAKVRQLLGPLHRHDDLAEEVAARVWYAVLADDYHLLSVYDPNRGRLGTFLGRRALLEMLTLLRSHANRNRHESCYRNRRTEAVVQLSLPEALIWQEIMPQLTDTERHFFQQHLLSRSTSPLPSPTIGQLRYGIRRKIVAYLQDS